MQHRAFGTQAVPPPPVLKTLPKIFAHTDKNVRVDVKRLESDEPAKPEPSVVDVLEEPMGHLRLRKRRRFNDCVHTRGKCKLILVAHHSRAYQGTKHMRS